jgi:hypothetical protein
MLKARGQRQRVVDHLGLRSKGTEVALHRMRSLRSRGKRWWDDVRMTWLVGTEARGAMSERCGVERCRSVHASFLFAVLDAR